MFQLRAPVLQKLTEDIRVRGLSSKTEKSYRNSVDAFLRFCNKPVEELNEQDARQYSLHLQKEGKARATINLHMSAIRFLFGATLGRHMNYHQMPRMKGEKKLPLVLNVDEVCSLIDSCENLKRKAMLLLAYGSGLRASEIVALRIRHIESKNNRIFVELGKGGKDRYALLPEATLLVLREYFKKNRSSLSSEPDAYIFPGCGTDSHISPDTLLTYVKDAARDAGIHKPVTVHTLRHCFATHLYEMGTDLLKIKTLLGHSCIQSTTIYVHLAKFESDTVSPLDNLNIVLRNQTK